MAIIFCDGFDHYATANITDKWDANTRGYSLPGPHAAIGSTYGRFSTAGLGIYDNWTRVWKAVPSGPQPVLTMGCAFMPSNGVGTSNHIIMSFMGNGYGMCGIGVTQLHQLFAFYGWYQANTAPYGGNIDTILGYGSKPIRSGVYQYVEFSVPVIGSTTGQIKCWLDGDLVIDLSDISNNYGGSDEVEAFSLGGHAAYIRSDYPGVLCYDDVYVTDQADPVAAGNTGRIGDVRINEQTPNADGYYQEWIPSSGSTHHEMVDEIPPDDDTTYVSTLGIGARDTYTFPSVVPTYGTVKAVCVNFYARKLDSGYSGISCIGRLSGTDDNGDEADVGGQYAIFQSYMEKDPTGATWTVANVNASEFGVELTS